MMKIILLFVVLVICDPDLLGFTPNIEQISSCSYVIPMDVAYQAGAPTDFDNFNLAAYGLVNKLLWEDIPVKWVIKTGKQHNEADFTALSYQIYPESLRQTQDMAEIRSFGGGPFIITTVFTELANAHIADFGRNVSVYRIMDTINVDVRYTLMDRPFVAVLDSSSKNYILVNALETAGFVKGEHYRIMSKEEANNLDSTVCITMAMEPHFHCIGDTDMDKYGPRYCESFVNAMSQFINSGGNFYSMCGGILTYEQCDNDDGLSNYRLRAGYSVSGYKRELPPNNQSYYCPSGGHVTTGLNAFRANVPPYELREGSNATGEYKNIAPDTPYSQWTGSWWFNDWSSIESMSLWNTALDSSSLGTVTRNTTLKAENGAHWVITEGSSRDSVGYPYGLYYAAHAKLQKFHGKKGGNIFYLAGHDYGLTWPGKFTGSSHDNSCTNCTSCYNYPCVSHPGRRMLLNAVLTPANRTGCSINVTVCGLGGMNCTIVQKTFTVDPCRWGTCKTLKRASSTPTSPPYQCTCTQRLDKCGVCGGNNTACIVNEGTNFEIVPPGTFPEGLVPEGQGGTIIKGSVPVAQDPDQPQIPPEVTTLTKKGILALISSAGSDGSPIQFTNITNVTIISIDIDYVLLTATITFSENLTETEAMTMSSLITQEIAASLGLPVDYFDITAKNDQVFLRFHDVPLPPTGPVPTPTVEEVTNITIVTSNIGKTTEKGGWDYYYLFDVTNETNNFFVYITILTPNPANVYIYLTKNSSFETFDCKLNSTFLEYEFDLQTALQDNLCPSLNVTSEEDILGDWYLAVYIPDANIIYKIEGWLEAKTRVAPRAPSRVSVGSSILHHQSHECTFCLLFLLFLFHLLCIVVV
eukprot:TRINITY_DN5560_c0_g2_i1.p1 TRINITY_DN5560_c0_g2~~TRINITY_DN5560_c0_g2_i1.p1  ORF type:complete len:865 (-),score=179.26 TRINITY_DN5560_c0_g2_i1:72-2666(-)